MLLRRRLESLTQRIFELLVRISARLNARSKRVERIVMLVAVLIFVAGSVFAYVNLPRSVSEPNWGLLAGVAIVGVPLTVATNAAEYVLSVNMVGYRAPFGSALKVSLLATAANMLPLPGSVLVRTEAVRRLGAKMSKALATSTVVGIAWLATAATLTGVLLLAHGRVAVGTVATGAGALLLGATFLLCFRLDPSSVLTTSSRLIVVESGSVLVKAARLYVIFRALDYTVGLDQALVLTSAAVVSTATGFFPAGMGATEVLSAAVSPLVDLPPALSLLAAAVDRIIGLAGLAVLSGIVLLRAPRFAGDVREMGDASEVVRGRSKSIP